MVRLLCGAIVLFGVFLFRRQLSLRGNIKIAEKSKLPFIVVPFYTGTPLWYFCYSWILPAFRSLPRTWTSPWLE